MDEARCWDGQVGSLIRASGIRTDPSRYPRILVVHINQLKMPSLESTSTLIDGSRQRQWMGSAVLGTKQMLD